MLKTLTTFALCCATLQVAAQGQKENWLNPLVNRVNCELPKSDFFAFENTSKAQTADKTQSSHYLSLEGLWNFNFVYIAVRQI